MDDSSSFPPFLAQLTISKAPSVGLAVTSKALTISQSLISQAFFVGVSQAPSLVKGLLPTGTTESQIIQIGDFSSKLGDITEKLKAQFNTALETIMSDIPTFNAFAATGNWSGENDLSMPQTETSLNYMFKTYLTSEALKANQWSGIPGKVVTQEAWDGGRWYWGNAVHKPDPNNNRFAGGFFRSAITGRVYSLIYKHGDRPSSGISSSDAIHSISDNGWASLETLFDGSYNCTASGKAGGSEIIGFNTDGTLNVGCVSRLPIYHHCYEDCPQKLPDGSCPFGVLENCNA